MTDVAVEIKQDGREVRADRNRTALIHAGMRLIERDANWRSTSDQIATEAGVSRRTFFNHFTNVEYFRQVLVTDYKPQLLSLASRLDSWEKILGEIMR
jgi:AcrR family transcriptional regulator